MRAQCPSRSQAQADPWAWAPGAPRPRHSGAGGPGQLRASHLGCGRTPSGTGRFGFQLEPSGDKPLSLSFLVETGGHAGSERRLWRPHPSMAQRRGGSYSPPPAPRVVWFLQPPPAPLFPRPVQNSAQETHLRQPFQGPHGRASKWGRPGTSPPHTPREEAAVSGGESGLGLGV